MHCLERMAGDGCDLLGGTAGFRKQRHRRSSQVVIVQFYRLIRTEHRDRLQPGVDSRFLPEVSKVTALEGDTGFCDQHERRHSIHPVQHSTKGRRAWDVDQRPEPGTPSALPLSQRDLIAVVTRPRHAQNVAFTEQQMTRIIVVVREVGKLNPDYYLEFDVPEVPSPGSYLSIHRPDNPQPYSEDMIVDKVWWRLEHPETRCVTSGDEKPKVGSVIETVVECVPATGPYSCDRWRDMLDNRRKHGAEIPEFEVARVQIRQDAMIGSSAGGEGSKK
jgi:hypothetical protein